jgi:hypothetical protein
MSELTSLKALSIKNLHDEYLSNSNWPESNQLKFQQSDLLFKFIEMNHFFNTKLWNEEDLARRKKVPDSEIANNKRAIDKFNQSRNDFIEEMDNYILNKISILNEMQGKQNSETPGAIIDRLSILSLKIFHMAKQTQREGVSENHKQTCEVKLKILITQRNDLCVCFDELIFDLINKVRHFKQYKQFKMYNDPNLNPKMYDEK